MGPARSILLRHPLTHEHIAEIDTWLKTFTHDVSSHTPEKMGDWWFHVDDLTALSLTASEQPCSFGLTPIDPSHEMGEDEQEQIMIAVGFWPRNGLNIWAGCHRHLDHLVLGHLALHLMERYNGLLELGNLDISDVEPMPSRKQLQQQVEESWEQSLPGRCYPIVYWRSDRHSWWYSALSNAERLRAHLQHPDTFNLPK